MTGTTEKFDTVVIGLGKTGMSCIRYFSAGGVSVAVTDSRMDPPELATVRREYPEVPVFLGGFDVDLLCSAGQLVVSPGVPLDDPAIRAAAARGISLVGDIEIFCRQTRVPIIGITGSNGKSTVASLLHEMIGNAGRRSVLAGNIGTPVLDLNSDEAVDYYVLELSSFQLELVYSLNALAAVVLNVTPDHMDRYPDFSSYAAAKARVYAGDGTMVINHDDEQTTAGERSGRNYICYSLTVPAAGDFGIRMLSGERWLCRGETGLLPVSQVRLRGDHNLSNCLAALALGAAIGLPITSMLEVLHSFAGLPHRCQWIADTGGVEWYDDSKGTNVGASCSAIAGLAEDNNLILIAGGIGKGADFSKLAEAARGRLRSAILIGRDARQIAAVLEAVVPVTFATTMDAAVRAAAEIAREGDAVLLSPACASFDMFADFRARGQAFKQAVAGLQDPTA